MLIEHVRITPIDQNGVRLKAQVPGRSGPAHRLEARPSSRALHTRWRRCSGDRRRPVLPTVAERQRGRPRSAEQHATGQRRRIVHEDRVAYRRTSETDMCTSPGNGLTAKMYSANLIPRPLIARMHLFIVFTEYICTQFFERSVKQWRQFAVVELWRPGTPLSLATPIACR